MSLRLDLDTLSKMNPVTVNPINLQSMAPAPIQNKLNVPLAKLDKLQNKFSKYVFGVGNSSKGREWLNYGMNLFGGASDQNPKSLDPATFAEQEAKANEPITREKHISNQIDTSENHTTDIVDFINIFNRLGIQLRNCFEVTFNFAGNKLFETLNQETGEDDYTRLGYILPNTLTFYAQSIDIPAVKISTTEIYYQCRPIEIPVAYDYDRNFNMTVINDATGMIHRLLQALLIMQPLDKSLDSHMTITITSLWNNSVKSNIGCEYKLKNVRLENVGGLSFGHHESDIQTFNVSGKILEYDNIGRMSEFGQYGKSSHDERIERKKTPPEKGSEQSQLEELTPKRTQDESQKSKGSMRGIGGMLNRALSNKIRL